MKSITLHDKTFVPFISNQEIESAIDKVAEKLNEKHINDEQPPILLCILNGALMFTSELMKRLDFVTELVTVKLASYEGTQSSGKIREDMGLTGDVRGRNVIICEHIVDTGKTIVYLKNLLKEKGAANVEVCTMLLKPDIYKQDVVLDYVAMEIPPRFIVGFGLDYDQIGRGTKDIYVLEE